MYTFLHFWHFFFTYFGDMNLLGHYVVVAQARQEVRLNSSAVGCWEKWRRDQEPVLVLLRFASRVSTMAGIFKYFPKIMRHTYKFENDTSNALNLLLKILLIHISLRMNNTIFLCHAFYDKFFI